MTATNSTRKWAIAELRRMVLEALGNRDAEVLAEIEALGWGLAEAYPPE